MSDYYTIGVIYEPRNPKQYTFKVPNTCKLAIDDYVAVNSNGLTLVQVKAIHNEPKDTESYEYKFIAGTLNRLPEIVPAPSSAPNRL